MCREGAIGYGTDGPDDVNMNSRAFASTAISVATLSIATLASCGDDDTSSSSNTEASQPAATTTVAAATTTTPTEQAPADIAADWALFKPAQAKVAAILDKYNYDEARVETVNLR